MTVNHKDKNELLALRDDMSPEEVVHVLRANALKAHQLSVGRGDMLVTFLERTVKRIESTHNRLQFLSTLFFAFGLLVIGTGIYVALFGNAGGEVWGSMFGVGGITSAVSVFYTAPLNRIAKSVRDLIQLETAFLGYIRVIGEIDSAFQWQYIERMANVGGPEISLIAKSACDEMKAMMDKTMELIDKYTSVDSPSKTAELRDQLAQIERDLDGRIKKLEGE